MRVIHSLLLLVLLGLVTDLCLAAPQSRLQVSGDGVDGGQFIEEVTLQTTLYVRRPASSARQSRTNTQTNLKDGARVAETYNKN